MTTEYSPKEQVLKFRTSRVLPSVAGLIAILFAINLAFLIFDEPTPGKTWYGIFIIFFLVMISLAMFTYSDGLIIDKSIDSILISKKIFFLKKEAKYPIGSFSSLSIVAGRDKYGKERAFYLFLVGESSIRLPLTRFHLEYVQEKARQLGEFLKIPIETQPPYVRGGEQKAIALAKKYLKKG